jgi:hypothetical protein
MHHFVLQERDRFLRCTFLLVALWAARAECSNRFKFLLKMTNVQRAAQRYRKKHHSRRTPSQ